MDVEQMIVNAMVLRSAEFLSPVLLIATRVTKAKGSATCPPMKKSVRKTIATGSDVWLVHPVQWR